MKQVLAMALLATILIAGSSAAEEPDPEALVREVVNSLKAATTVRVVGETFSSTDTHEGLPTINLSSKFTLTLARPNRYRIEWEQPIVLLILANRGVVWNDGKGPRLYMSIMNEWESSESDEIALARATGVSNGVAHTIPCAFFSWEQMPSPLEMMRDFVYEGVEDVDGTPCHKISARSLRQREHTLWIERDRPLLKKLQFQLGSAADEEITEGIIDEQLVEMGREVNADTRLWMRDKLERQQKISGYHYEQYTLFELDHELGDDAFEFVPPDTATERVEEVTDD